MCFECQPPKTATGLLSCLDRREIPPQNRTPTLMFVYFRLERKRKSKNKRSTNAVMSVAAVCYRGHVICSSSETRATGLSLLSLMFHHRLGQLCRCSDLFLNWLSHTQALPSKTWRVCEPETALVSLTIAFNGSFTQFTAEA